MFKIILIEQIIRLGPPDVHQWAVFCEKELKSVLRTTLGPREWTTECSHALESVLPLSSDIPQVFLKRLIEQNIHLGPPDVHQQVVFCEK